MHAFRLLLLAGSLLTLSFGGYAVIHSMNSEERSAPDETSRPEEARAGVASGAETMSPGATAKSLEPTEVTTAAQIEALRGLRTEIVRLRAELVALGTRLASVEQADSNEPHNPYSDDGGVISQMELYEVPSQAELNDETYRRIEVMDSDFYAETVDARWSPEAVEVIGQAFQAKELAGTDVVNMQCRATRCRLEVAHGDSTDRGAFELWFPAMVATMFPRATFNQIQEEDGRSSTVIYLDRDD